MRDSHFPEPLVALEAASARPIGVFDSGIGGLSILRALLAAMPEERFVYLADTAYAPYGERGDPYVLARSERIAGWMHDEVHARGLIIACNTATAAAARTLRSEYGQLWPIVGVEPALRPAAIGSRSGRIGVLATAGTLHSLKFQSLLKTTLSGLGRPTELLLHACDGLAEAIEHGHNEEIETLIELHVAPLAAARIDTAVLGCTHYPLVADRIARALPGVALIDTAAPVARHARDIFCPGKTLVLPAHSPRLTAWTSGDVGELAAALHRWLPGQTAEIHRWVN